MKTVLITGVAGFIGRQAAGDFRRAGYRVIGTDQVAAENAPLGDLDDYRALVLPDAKTELLRLLTAEQPTLCLHCAGRASVPFSVTDPEADFRVGVDGTFALLDAMRLAAVPTRMIYLSSAAVYGEPGAGAIHEETPLRPISPYGFHKLMGEALCREFNRVYGVKCLIIRIFSAYGPGLRRQVLWDLSRRLLREPVVTVQGTGKESRDFIHVRDIARALLLLAERGSFAGQVYNLASGVETTIAALAELLRTALDRQTELRFDGRVPPGTPQNWRADIGRLAALGFEPGIGLAEGVCQYAAWCRSELEEA